MPLLKAPLTRAGRGCTEGVPSAHPYENALSALSLPCGIVFISQGRERAEKGFLEGEDTPPNLPLTSLGPGVDTSMIKTDTCESAPSPRCAAAAGRGARGDERGQWEASGSAFHPTIREPDPHRVMSELIS
jgi:hypothetical protein